MKQKIAKKIVSVVLVLAMVMCTVPVTEIATFASDMSNTDTTGTTVADEKELTAAEAIEKEVAERNAIKKDRSKIKKNSQAAVYYDGVLYKEGDFSSMWNTAMDLAAYVNLGKGESNDGRVRTVEFVLNKDMLYDATWFGEETMTISNKIFTIDLNGHLLHRKDKDGSVIKVTKGSILTIMDSNPTKKNTGVINQNNLWEPSGSGDKIIQGGVISGGYYKTGDGGGLYIDKNSTVYMTGGTIAGNKADVGAAVYLEGNSTLDMSLGTSQICYNYCAGTTTDGGAIFLRSNCTVIGGYVHHNLADDYGGGIRAKGNNILIKGVIVSDNKAEEEGGGLYIERDGTEQTVTISGCKIVGNHAGEKGGGVYLYDLYLAEMIDCSVEDNEAGESGGGICVSDWTGTDLSISGKIIVRNNYESTKDGNVKSNLYLEGDDDLIIGTLSYMSEIWVKTEKVVSEKTVSVPIVSESTTASYLLFFSDVEGTKISYQNNPEMENYRYLCVVRGERQEHEKFTLEVLKDYSAKQQNTPYIVETGAYKGENIPLYKGYFEYNLMTTSEYLSASPFYYSDGYFLEDPTVYNTHLATMSINVAVAAFGRNTTDVGDNAYANHFANVKQLFADIGCDDVNFFANEDYQIKPTYYGEEGRLSTIGVAISQKEITVGEDSYTLVPVAIRGGGYESEWSSNVSIGKDGEAKGFSDAANQVYTHIQNYIENYGLSEKVESGKVKFWVVGYSRAGATANLTSKRLVDSYAEGGNQVYGYTFEAPMGGVNSAIQKFDYTGNGTYPTIHNTVNENDFVTLVAPTEMGFIRYGVDHLIGSDYNNGIYANSEYYARKELMIQQLRAINPYYEFDDNWAMAELSIYGAIFGNGIMDTEIQGWDDPNVECESMYTFLRWFFLKVQEDGLNLNADLGIGIDKSREYYSTYKPFAVIEGNKMTADLEYRDPNYNFGYSPLSVEESAAKLVSMLMGTLTDEQMNELITVAMGGGMELADEYLDFDLWLLILSSAAFLVSAIVDVAQIYDVYADLIVDWDTHSEQKKAELINWLLHKIFDAEVDGKMIWDVLDEEQAQSIAEALPVVLWFALNFVSKDYNTTSDDDGMWGIPTFITNASAITSNHYQEVTVAWVRSNDNYYANDLQAYRIDTAGVVNAAPTGKLEAATNTITLSAENGSSIYYSVDGGKSWNLYTKAVSLEETPEQVLTFSIYRGVKSEVKDIALNAWSGSLLGSGNIWFIIIGSVLAVGFCGVIIVMNRKKKQMKNEQ